MTERPPRTWESLREKPDNAPNDDLKETAIAMWRLSLTPDGKKLIAWLRETSTFKVLTSSCSDSALRMLEGRRQVPAEIERFIKAGERYASESNASEPQRS